MFIVANVELKKMSIGKKMIIFNLHFQNQLNR